MADRYASRMGLVLDQPVDDVGAVVDEAIAAGDVDRLRPVGDATEAVEVNWGGRMQKAVVRSVIDPEDDAPLLRVETYLGSDGLVTGMRRQAQLLQGLARQLRGRVDGVRDLAALQDHDEAWLARIAIGAVEQDDAIVVRDEGEGTPWVYTMGAARFDVPDLELYGLTRARTVAAADALRHLHQQLLRGGLKARLSLADGTPVYLVPVLEAWQHLPLDWPGVGKAGQQRGRNLDGPRATVSVLHKPRFGRYRRDFQGVLDRL